MKQKSKTVLKLVFANLAIFFICLISIEGIGQIYYVLHPQYEQSCDILDKKLGWKRSPNCNFTATGGQYNSEFKTKIFINSHGFRDKERTLVKPKNTIRIAFLGDSMVEALQVPFENTAPQILEKKLNAMNSPKSSPNYEVLNFGVGNFGLGQMLLTYKNIASKFDPDFVLVFVNEYLMERSIEYQLNEKLINQNRYHSHRPIFELERAKESFFKLLSALNSGQTSFFQSLQSVKLKWRPSKEFENDGKAERLIQGIPESTKETREKRKLFLSELITNLKMNLKPYIKNEKFKIMKETDNSWQNRTRLFINFKILDQFSDSSLDPKKIILLDSSKYYNQTLDRSILSIFLKSFSQYKGYSYLDITEPLLDAEKNGTRIRWKGDPHFNEQGHKFFGEELFTTLKDHLN
jgi:hypothetical protein